MIVDKNHEVLGKAPELTLTAAAAPTPSAGRDPGGVTVLRLNLLRANYLIWAVAGLFLALPPLFAHGATDRGMIDSMLAGLWVMGLLGLRYPLQMLPILLFEFSWKTIWLLFFGLPQWLGGGASPRLNEDLLSIGNGPILFGLIIPWKHVWIRYVKKPSEPWR